MKILRILFIPVFVLCVAACSSGKREPSQKLYIEDGEYEADNRGNVNSERPAAPPVVESDYIFRILPQGTYFYDEKDMPLDEPVKKAEDYKSERLWKKPKRYMNGSGGGEASSDD